MAVIYEIKKRRVVPNWRDFARTLKLGELANTTNLQPLNIDLTRPITDWKVNQNIGVAADLINSAFIAGKTDFPELDEAINYVVLNKESASNSLLDLAYNINGLLSRVETENKTTELEIETIDEFQSYVDNNVIHQLIHDTKKRAHKELYNPILWVELSRLYSFYGLENKAIGSMVTAINLAPNNRFVLRSATRLFIHFEDFDKALFYLRRSEYTRHDPWLTSAHIATSSIIERYSPFMKSGRKLVDSKNFSDYDLTELASTLGTVEYSEGAIKKSKKLFEQSLKSPNDNSLAQFEWIAKQDRKFLFNPFLYKNVKNPFEAFALEQFENGNWKDAFNNSIKWFLDTPYSKRPVLLGSYVASTFLKDPNTSVILCKAGLRANPNDPSILNNMVYSLALSDQVEEAVPYIEAIKKIDLNSLPNETKITIQATFGLVAFRSGITDLGKELYQNAILSSEKINNEYFKNLALVNYARELVISMDEDCEVVINKLRSTKMDPNSKDLVAHKNDILELYERKKSSYGN